MKNIFYLFLLLLFVGCADSRSENNKIRATDSKDMSHLLGQNDADRILGEKSHLKESSFDTASDTAIYQCAYEADAVDTNGITGVIYFVCETYKELISAHAAYDYIKKGNEAHGIKVLQDMGDEAYFHTDNEHFYFILARKGNKMYRMKVNKLTSHTSLDAFNAVAKEITSKL